MQSRNYKVEYRYVDDERTHIHILTDEHPIDWWESLKDKVMVLEWSPATWFDIKTYKPMPRVLKKAG